MIARMMALFLSVYIPLYFPFPVSISGGFSTQGPNLAFDGDTATFFNSSQQGSGISGVSYVGILLPHGELLLTPPFRIVLDQCGSSTNAVTAVKYQVHTGLGWNSGTSVSVGNTITAFNTSSGTAVDGIRLMADANLTGSNRWRVCEVYLYMIQPDAYVASDTPTPTATLTPTITPTPSNTPTSTPNFQIVITSTQGSPMALDRTATFGDLIVAMGLFAVFLILLVTLAWQFWNNRRA